jgi:dynein light chain Tctex-type 1
MQFIAQSAIQDCLDGRTYDDTRVEAWSNHIVTQVLDHLKAKLTPQFKFIASCMVLSRRSQHVNETQMALWDTARDVRITTKWANETMQCIISVWAFRSRFG